MRIVVKGGIWRNAEDEILKSAISKYGKNQWARISSLLVRKTAKQVKARWLEWLDPSIRKTPWSKDEDEKLLHLAKLMPTQWRTIAPIVGRTANQCLERYQKLLDEAEQQESDELGLQGIGAEAGPSADEIRRLRPGEVDPDPETRPARPDPVDMDEDEKEMLSEARARLANTEGKKSKRKARERLLEEARRLAILQKKRELKSAGIFVKSKPKKGNGMDYNADIPFEKQPAAGFYDTTLEKSKRYAAPVGKSLESLHGTKRKQEYEEEERKKKAQRTRDQKDASHFVTKDTALEARKEEQQISKRRRLVLPGPQVGESELEEIVKIGLAGESARALVMDDEGNASQGLLGEYSALGHAKDVRTPRTAPEHDNVMAEARNIRTLSMQQTPLLGEENTPLRELMGRGSGFEGATPRGTVSATPNPLATPFRSDSSDISATPRSVAGHETPLRTPMRDSLSINNDDGSSALGETPRLEKLRLSDVKNSLRKGFASLPEPRNEFELVMPEDEALEGNESEEMQAAMRIEDSDDREARLAAIRAAEAATVAARRSQAVKRGLPRPIEFEAQSYLAALDSIQVDEEVVPAGGRAEFERLIAIEMVQLLQHDSILYPVAGSKRAGGGQSHLDTISDADLAAARLAVHDEVAQTAGLPGAHDAVLRRTVNMAEETFSAIWNPVRSSLAYDATTKTYIPAATMNDSKRIQGYAALLEMNRALMGKESAKAAKVEKKLGITLGGYQARSVALATKLSSTCEDVARTRLELASFDRLASNEQGAMRRRMESLRDDVNKLESHEREGQRSYKELVEVREALVASVEALELDEAEEINERAMVAMET